MATVTGASLVAGIESSTGVTLNAVLKASLTAKLQQLIDTNTYSPLSAAIALQGFSSQIKTVVDANGGTAAFVNNVTAVKTAVENGTTIPTFGSTTPTNPTAFPLTAGADDKIVGTSANDTITGTQATYQNGDLIIDTSSTDNDTLALTTNANLGALATVAGIENVTVAVSKVGLFTFDAANITGLKTLTVNRGDVMDGAIDGTGAVQIDNAKAATFVAGTKVSNLTVDFQNGQTAAAVVDARAATGNVVVGDIGAGGVTVYGVAGKNVTLTDDAGTAKTSATVISSGNVTLTQDTTEVDTLTLSGSAAVTYTLAEASGSAAIGDKLILTGGENITVKIAGDDLTGETIESTATGTTTIDVTAASTGNLDLSNVANVTSVVLSDDFSGETITVKTNQLITTKTNQTTTVTINNAGTAGSGTARFAVLDNGADTAVSVATLDFGAGVAFDTVYLDATADALTATAAVDVTGAALVLTGSKTITLTDVIDAGSITSASTGKVVLKSSGNVATDQAIALGAGDDEVEVNESATTFAVNLGAGANKLTITDAKTESQFVTGAGNDNVTLTNAQTKVSVSTGAGADTVTLGALTNVTNLTLAAGDGADTVIATTTKDLKAATLAITGVETFQVNTGVTLTVNATQFSSLGAFELKGEGVFAVTDTSDAGVTINASVLSLGFGTTATTKLTGAAGADTITGTVGADVMEGKAGADTFVFSSGSGNTTTLIDEIVDFVTATDKIKTGIAGTGEFAELVVDSGATDQLATAGDALAAANAAGGFGTTHLGKNFLFLVDTDSGVDGWLAIDWDADGAADQLIKLTGLNASGDVVASDIIA